MEEEEPQRWYNSTFIERISTGIGIGAVILSFTFGMRLLLGPLDNSVENERAKHRYILQERDLNKDGNVERFYEIGGEKYFSTIDGKNLGDSLK